MINLEPYSTVHAVVVEWLVLKHVMVVQQQHQPTVLVIQELVKSIILQLPIYSTILSQPHNQSQLQMETSGKEELKWLSVVLVDVLPQVTQIMTH